MKPPRLRIAALTSSLLLLAGCTVALPWDNGPKTCPGPYDYGLVASIVETSTSTVRLFRGGTVVGDLTINVAGIGPQTPVRANNGDLLLLAEGRTFSDHAKIVRINPATCAVRMVDSPIQAILGMAEIADVTYITASSGMSGTVVALTADGVETHRITVEGKQIWALAGSGGSLYAFASKIGQDPALYRFSSDLVLQEKMPLEIEDGRVSDLAASGDRLFLPIHSKGPRGEADSTLLGSFATTDRALSLIDLKSRAPLRIVNDGTYLWIVHTFINPSQGPLSEFRHISRVTLATGDVRGADLPFGVDQLATSKNGLFVTGIAEYYASKVMLVDPESLAVLAQYDVGYPPGPTAWQAIFTATP